MRKVQGIFLLLLIISPLWGQLSNDTLSPVYLKCDVGFLIGTVESEMKAPFSFMSSINFKLNRSVNIGTGMGLEFFQTTYIPAYVTLSVKPFPRQVIFSLSAGYTFPLNNRATFSDGYEYRFYEGYFFNPEISYVFFNSNKRHAFIIGVGYRYQQTDAKRITGNIYQPYYYPYYDYSLITVLNRFSLRLGYLFF